MLNASQQMVAAYRYDPFGTLLAKTGTFDQPFQFSTKRDDARIGMAQYQFRNYLSHLGRWMTRDPLGEAGGLNLYAFVGQNPVNWVDPWGLMVINSSDYVVYYKPEIGSEAFPIMPHMIYPGSQDGIAIPCVRPEEVFKTVTNIDATVHNDGTVTVSVHDTSSWWKEQKAIAGQILPGKRGGGWKDGNWHTWLKDRKKDGGWDELFDASQPENCK